MLEATGLDADEECVYRLLVTTFEGDPAAVSERLGLAGDRAEAVLESLHGRGLVTRSDGPPVRYQVNPPDVALGPMLLRGQEALEGARTAVNQLSEEYRASVRRRDANQLVEVITGAPALRQQLRNLQLSAREEMVWLCKAGHVAMPSADNEEEFTALAAGIRYRVIYEHALLEEPGMIAGVAEGIEHGEEARAMATLPVRLAIADRRIGLCPLVPGAEGSGEPTAALIRDSSLLAAFAALFESYWERASPLQLTGETLPREPAIADDEKYLLSLLVAGVADKAIASQLRISQRTVQRRIYDLMRRSNTQTRMQLAWQAAKLGWLD